LAPITIASIIESYNWLQNSDEYTQARERLNRNISLVRLSIKNKGIDNAFIESNSPIQSYFITGNSHVKAAAIKLQDARMDVRPIMAPTVAKGEERLRICLHSFNTEQQILKLLDIVSQLE